MRYFFRVPNLWFGIIISDDGAKLSRLYYRNEKSNNHATKIYRNIKYLQIDLRIKTFKPQINAVVDVDLGSSFMEMKRQEKIASDEQLVMETFEAIKLPDAPVAPEVEPEGFDFQGSVAPGGEVNDESGGGTASKWHKVSDLYI